MFTVTVAIWESWKYLLTKWCFRWWTRCGHYTIVLTITFTVTVAVWESWKYLLTKWCFRWSTRCGHYTTVLTITFTVTVAVWESWKYPLTKWCFRWSTRCGHYTIVLMITFTVTVAVWESWKYLSTKWCFRWSTRFGHYTIVLTIMFKDTVAIWESWKYILTQWCFRWSTRCGPTLGSMFESCFRKPSSPRSGLVFRPPWAPSSSARLSWETLYVLTAVHGLYRSVTVLGSSLPPSMGSFRFSKIELEDIVCIDCCIFLVDLRDRAGRHMYWPLCIFSWHKG